MVPPGARAARGAELERQEVKEVVVKAAVSTERQEAKEVVLDSLSESKKPNKQNSKAQSHDETQIIPINDMRTHRGNPMCGLVHDHRAAAGLVAHAHIWSRAHVYTRHIGKHTHERGTCFLNTT